MSSQQTEREQGKIRGVAEILIGIPPDPSFVGFREDFGTYNGPHTDPCPIVILWKELVRTDTVANQIMVLLQRELELIHDTSMRKGNGAVDLVTGIQHGWRFSKPLAESVGLEYFDSERNGLNLPDRNPKGLLTVLIEDYTSRSNRPETIKMKLKSKGIETAATLAVVINEYPGLWTSFDRSRLPLRHLTSIQAIAKSPFMGRFDERQVGNLNDWVARQQTFRG